MSVNGSVGDLIRERLGEFSPAERRVGRTLLAAYPTAGLETVAALAARAGVSGPTVVRFVTRLGYSGFPDFQQALRAEIDERNTSPLSLYTQRRRGPVREGAQGLLDRAGQVLPQATRATLASTPAAELQAAIALLADPGRRITAAGGRFSRLLAHYLVLHLMQLRADSHLLPESPVERVDALADVSRRDVFVLFDYRRYEPATTHLAARVSGQGAKVILLTDRWLSPASGVADVVLPSHVDSPSAYDSFAPSVALVEVLVAGVLTALGESARHRLEAVEALGHDLTLL